MKDTNSNPTSSKNPPSLVKYCSLSFICCVLVGWIILSVWFKENMLIPSIFLSIVPGIIIGAIFYHISRTDYGKRSSLHNGDTLTSIPNMDKLIELKKLVEQGIISEEEFNKIKDGLLKNIAKN